MNPEEVRSIVSEIEFSDWVFEVREIESMHPDVDGVSLIRVSFLPWGDKEKSPMQHGRWWYIGSNAVKSEVVQTALLAVLTAVEHEVREDFTYKGRKVFSPHWNTDLLAEYQSSQINWLDVRKERQNA